MKQIFDLIGTLSEASPWILIGLGACFLFLGVWIGLLWNRSGVRREHRRQHQEIKRLELQVREQARHLSKIQIENTSLANLIRALPDAVGEINQPQLTLEKVREIIVRLTRVTFSPEQILLFQVRSPGVDQNAQELRLKYHQGLPANQDLSELQTVKIGEGRFGFVAKYLVEMTKDDWAKEMVRGGDFVQNPFPAIAQDLIGPLIQRTSEGDQVLGVLSIGNPGTKAFNDKLLLQMITSLGSIALMKSFSMQQLRLEAQRDGLTGLVNKRHLMQELSHMISAAESNGEPLGLFIFDIDHFKIYNDTNGHLAGDELLKSISKLIRNSLRPGDLAARYGGEEFVIAMPGASQDVAFQVANRLRETIEHNAFAHAHHQPSGKLTISGGVASYSDDAKSVTELISHADQALYQAKASGRNKVRRYQPIEFGNVNINYSDNLPKTKKGSTGKP